MIDMLSATLFVARSGCFSRRLGCPKGSQGPVVRTVSRPRTQRPRPVTCSRMESVHMPVRCRSVVLITLECCRATRKRPGAENTDELELGGLSYTSLPIFQGAERGYVR